MNEDFVPTQCPECLTQIRVPSVYISTSRKVNCTSCRCQYIPQTLDQIKLLKDQEVKNQIRRQKEELQNQIRMQAIARVSSCIEYISQGSFEHYFQMDEQWRQLIEQEFTRLSSCTPVDWDEYDRVLYMLTTTLPGRSDYFFELWKRDLLETALRIERLSLEGIHNQQAAATQLNSVKNASMGSVALAINQMTRED